MIYDSLKVLQAFYLDAEICIKILILQRFYYDFIRSDTDIFLVSTFKI